MRYQVIAYTVGIVLLVMGGLQSIPTLLDLADGNPDAWVFFWCGLLTTFSGGTLYFSFRGFDARISLREGFLLTNAAWLALTISGALPFWYSDLDVSPADAIFESVSGITTTGATVFVGLDTMPRGILMWRGILHGVGGAGIVTLAMLLLPFLHVGGMQLLQTESSDKSEKLMPRTRDVVLSFLLVYLLLNLLCALAYYHFGMSVFDAAVHALGTIATGGFSNYDASFGHFNSPELDTAAIVFMFFGGLPFPLFIALLYHGKFDFHKDQQVRAFLFIIVTVVGSLTLWLWARGVYDFGQSLRFSAFNVISILTSTGFVSTDYMQWGPFAAVVFLFITYLGACAGSTSGGMKVMRVVIAFETFKVQIKRLLYPSGVFSVRYQGNSLEKKVVQSVLGFLFLYVVANTFLTIAVTMTGVDFLSAVSGVAACMTNAGPGIGPIIGPAGNFSTLPDGAKWLLSLTMLLGRLEILTVLVLFTREFWRR